MRFWLEARHGYLVGEGIPVPVPHVLSDIDLVALHPEGKSIVLPGGVSIGPRVIVETKDEHDWEPSGKEFGKVLRADVAKMEDGAFVPRSTKDVRFSMLREEHFDRALALFGTHDFDRLFVVHAIDAATVADLDTVLNTWRVQWVTIPEVVRDLIAWYRLHDRPSGLRHTLVGDLLHLARGILWTRSDGRAYPGRRALSL